MNEIAFRKFNDHCALNTFELCNVDAQYNDETIREIIKYWFRHQNKTFCKISIKLSLKLNEIIDEKFIESLIVGNTNNHKLQTKTLPNKDLEFMKLQKFWDADKCYEKFCRSLTKFGESEESKLIIDISQTKFNVYINDHQNDFIPLNCMVYKNTNIVIDNFATKKWKIMKSRCNDDDKPKILFEMYSIDNPIMISDDYALYEEENIKSHAINNNNHFIQCISLSQSNDNNITINDPDLHTSVYKYIEDSLIHIKNNQNTNKIIILQQLNKNGKTCGIKIIDETSFGFTDTNHSDCWCDFKGIFIKK